MKNTLAIASLLLLGTAGCTTPSDEPIRPNPPPIVQGNPLTPLTKPLPPEEADKYILLVRLQIITLQVPIGSVSDSEELWSYLNEESVSSGDSSLPYNGVRVAVGTAASWQDVARVLRRITTQPLPRSNLLIRPGEPVPVVVKQMQDRQTIFTYRPDRTLSGQDYPPGDDVLMTATAVDLESPTSVHMQGGLLVRSAQRQPKFTDTEGGIRMVDQPEYFPLPGMTFRVKTPPGGFLLIGPGRQVRQPSSAGRQFMVRTRQGLDYETIIVLVPEVFVAPLPAPK